MAKKPTYKELEQRIKELEKEAFVSKRADTFEMFQKSEAFLESVIRAAPTGIGVVVDRVLTQVNKRMCEMIGYTEEELLGQNARILYPTNEDYEYVGREKYIQIRDHGTGTVETRFQRKDGQVINILMSSTPIDLSDLSKGVTFTALDITDRKRSEEALLAEHERFVVVMNALDALVYVADMETHDLIFMNNYGRDTWGNHLGEKCWSVLQAGETGPCAFCSNDKLLDADNNPAGPYIWEFQNTISEQWYQCRDQAIRWPDGRMVRLEIAINITERKIAEEALKTSEAKYRSMMEAMDDSAYICSKDLRVEYMNAAMIKRLGYDATGASCHRSIHGLEEKCPWCVHEKVMGGEFVKIEVVSPKDDKVFHVSNSPVYNMPGNISKLTIFRDITEMKKMEEKLRQAQKVESIGTLAGGIAHDFNNILSPLLGFAELLKEDLPTDSPLQEHINEILHATLRSKDLVKRILTFSRKDDQNTKPIQLHPIIKEALKFLRSSIPTTIDIQEDIDADCGFVIADATQVHQVVMNLVTNAYHAMEDDGGTLSVNLKTVDVLPDSDTQVSLDLMPGKYALLTVLDTGKGIEKEILDKVFDPYFTTKGVGKGSGLGLSVVHGIVKAYKGEIRIDSQPGKGTAVKVYLPIIEQTTEEKQVEGIEQVRGGTESILLVDDEVAIVRVVKQMLEKLGYQVTVRTSSVDTLETFKANSNAFDLLISDMTMPQMTGIQLAESLLSIRPDIPIIICTGFSEKLSEEIAKSTGIKGVLMKPVVRSVMAKMVRSVLDEARG